MFEKSLFRLVAAVVAAALLSTAGQAVTVVTVPVGNAANANDTHGDGYGGVDYTYEIGKYEVTTGQYTEFLNAVAATDTYGLYNRSMDLDDYGCQITRNGTSGSFSYDFSGCPTGGASDWENRPVNYVSWYDAARFCNWITTGATEDGVYKFSGGTLQSIMDHRAAAATYGTAYFIPTEDEWYKAAYYDPAKPGGAGYWDYPTKSDDPNVPSNDLAEPTDPGNNATIFTYPGDWTIGSPYHRTEIGAHENSESGYGTYDQGGNVWEWNETLIGGRGRGMRGGCYTYTAATMHAFFFRGGYDPLQENPEIGFRVASIPEPGTAVLGIIGVLCGLWWWRRAG